MFFKYFFKKMNIFVVGNFNTHRLWNANKLYINT